MNLVYITIRDYAEMAAQCVESLRGRGGHTELILVFTTGPTPFDDRIEKCATILRWTPTTHARFDRLMALGAIPQPGQYAAIMGLDADVLAFNDIEPLFETFGGHVRYMEERWQILGQCYGKGLPDDMYAHFLTPSERATFARAHPINIGHFVVPGQHAPVLHNLWRELALSAPNVRGADQAAFNALVRRGTIPSLAWGPHEVGNASNTPVELWLRHRLMHYAGFNDREATMRHWAPKLS